MAKLFVALAMAACMAAVASAGLISKMPGLEVAMPSKMYSGYQTVDATTNRRLFYFFVESYNNPATDPLVLWLNGGPGCSSLAAVFTEQGPFVMDFNRPGAGIKLNPWTWAKSANVIFLESPAGVGFSSSDSAADYTTGDVRTARDSYVFLQQFLKEFPQFQKHKFWVSGESYGGHYVPELTYKILQENKNVATTGNLAIDIDGFMAGNPWTDPEAEAFGVVQNWWDRAIMAESTYSDIKQFCTYKDITYWIIYNVSAGMFRSEANRAVMWQRAQMQAARWGVGQTANAHKCFAALHEASMVQFGNVDILGVYLDVCVANTKGNIPDQPNYCANGELSTYLNRADVWAALSVSQPVPSGKWLPCSSLVDYNFNNTLSSVLYIYEHVITQTNLKVLVYSGDNDAIVPFTGTRMWLRKLQRPVVRNTHEWFADTNGMQVAGWATQYDRLTFTTIRDAGHMVPYMQPQRAYEMFFRFIRDAKL